MAAAPLRFNRLPAPVTSRPAPAIILFGSPGSGKGTQAKLLCRYLKVPHISTGDMLRTHIEAGDDIGEQTRGLLKSGKLVSDDLVNQLVEARIAEPDCRSGIILDGYPRTVNQAAVLLEMMQQYGFKPAVIHLMVDHEKIVARLTGRRQCPVCGTLYSVTTHPPKIAGVCDLDGATLVPRDDDSEPVIRERLKQYDMQTRPLLNYFRQAGVPVIEIEGAAAPPQKIMRQISDSLASLGLVDPSIVMREAPEASVTP
ncbi:MAG: adenylate kinase family protein [Bryobacteraceae bacterium]